MAVLNQIPALYTPTLMVDIRDTLNANGAKVTDNLTTFFTPSANINVWSRRKPIVDNLNVQPIVMTTEDMAKQYNSGGVVARRYGLEMLGGAYKPSEVYAMVKANNNLGYRYPLPQAGSMSQPMRLSDFNGYYPLAKMPLETTFADGYEFDYLQYDYTLSGIELRDSDNPDDGQLYRKDIYPTENENGNAIGMIRGVYVRLTDGSYEFTVVGSLNFKTNTSLNAALSKLKGKEFEIFEFITNAPTSWSSFGSVDFVSAEYYCYALPMPISLCTMSSSGGSAPTIHVAKVVFTQYPEFFGLTATDYSTVRATFKLSAVGELYSGGSISLFACGIYSDAACTQIIQRRQFDGLTLLDEQETTTYNVMLSNTTGSGGVYFGIWFNGVLQYSGQVRAQAQATTINE